MRLRGADMRGADLTAALVTQAKLAEADGCDAGDAGSLFGGARARTLALRLERAQATAMVLAQRTE